MQASRHDTTADRPKKISVISYVARKLKRTLRTEEADALLSSLRIRKLFAENMSELAEAAIVDMRKLDLLDSEDNLTSDALMMLRIELERI